MARLTTLHLYLLPLSSQELEQIPLFMTKPPDEINAESAPALAALQDLIYRESTPHSECLLLVNIAFVFVIRFLMCIILCMKVGPRPTRRMAMRNSRRGATRKPSRPTPLP